MVYILDHDHVLYLLMLMIEVVYCSFEINFHDGMLKLLGTLMTLNAVRPIPMWQVSQSLRQAHLLHYTLYYLSQKSILF